MRRLFLVIILFMPVWVVAGSSIAVQDELLRLDNDDWQIRMSAAQALANLRPDDKSSIAAISLALKDDDSRVRRAAADALGEIGSSASRALPQIVSLFSDGDANVIAAAARAVGKIGSRSSRYSEDLIKLMAHRDERVREAATEALGASGRSRKRVDDLLKQLSDPAPSVRVAAAIVLGDIGPRAAPASQKIVRLLADDDASVREAAQQALAGIGKPAVRALMAAIGSGDPVFSLDIVATLVRIGSDSISALTETFGDSDGPLLARRYSAMALAKLYDTDARVIVVLTKGLVDENAEIRAAAAEGLGDVGMPAVSALPQLLLMSRDQREPSLVRERVISALADIAPADRDVNAALVAGVSDSNPRIYEAAIAALVEISSSPDSPASKELAQLVRDLQSGDDQSKSAAADRLGALGPYAATAVPDLIAVLAGQENSTDLQVAAATALGLIGSNAEAAVPELIRMLEVHDPALRDAVLIALERIGPQQKAVPALMRSMRAGDLATRASAAEAVRQFVNARLDTWRPLLHQSDAPVLRNWLSRHDELYGVGVVDLLVRAEPETDTPNYFDVLGGRAAIRESMQLDLIEGPVAGLNDEQVTPIRSIGSVDVDSHPFKTMLEKSNRHQPRLALAEHVPTDRFFAYFRSISALRNMFSGGGDQLLRFEAALALKSVQYDLEQQYLARMGFDTDLLERLESLNAITDIAIFTPDLFFVDGTDITAVVSLVSPSVIQSVLELFDLNASGLHWVISGDVLTISTSQHELELVAAIQEKNGKDSLGLSDEFLYMQQQLSIEESTEAYLYFSDEFIRKLVSPATKIGQLRRMEARAEMEMLVSGALLYLLDGHRKVPSKQQLIDNRYVPQYFAERDYDLHEDLRVSSEKFGDLARLKPLSSNSVSRATKREAEAYRQYVTDYRQYWQQFFDPVAMRLDRNADGTVELQTFILPLLDSALYEQVKEGLTASESGRRLKIPVLQPTPAMMMSTNLSDTARLELSKSLTDALVEFASVDPEIFNSIGSGLHLAVQDSTPIVALGSGDIWGAMSKEMVRMQGFEAFLPFILSLVSQPTTVLVELADADKVRQFMADAVARRAEKGGEGEFHQLRNKEAWIYSVDIAEMFTAHLRLEVRDGYLLISNLPWSTQVKIQRVDQMPLNGAHMRLNFAGMEKQLPALHTKVYTDYRASAVDGMGYLYPLLESGVSDSISDAITTHFDVFGFKPIHPGSGEWRWNGSHVESTEFGTALRPVQPEFEPDDRDFGVFPTLDDLSLNMQLEDNGLRATVRWQPVAK